MIHFRLTIYIGDIFKDPLNTDRNNKDYEHDGVDTHPKNWGMFYIAQRLYTATHHLDFDH